MTARLRVFVICLCAVPLSTGLAQAVPGAGHRMLSPKIKSGRYVDGSDDVYLDVRNQSRIVLFHFRLYCLDPFGSQYATSGPKPVRGRLVGIRRGATVEMDGMYNGAAESGSGIQTNFWNMKGKFTGPTHFEGRVEFEVGTFPARPQCLDAKLLHLDRKPPG